MKELSIATKVRIKNAIAITIIIIVLVIIAILTPSCSEHLCPAYF
jgi:hypothetical protein